MSILSALLKGAAGYALLSVIPSPQSGADAWSSGVSSAQTKYVSGVQNTTKDQAGLAVAQQSALIQNFTQAVQSGEWARRVLARGTGYWKQRTVDKAASYGASASTGKGNYLAAAQQLYPYEAQLQQQVDSMPSGTRADSLARFTTWMDGMIAFKQQYTP
jgi:hypothetical protein